MWAIKRDTWYYAGPCQWCEKFYNAVYFLDYAHAQQLAKQYGGAVYFRVM